MTTRLSNGFKATPTQDAKGIKTGRFSEEKDHITFSIEGRNISSIVYNHGMKYEKRRIEKKKKTMRILPAAELCYTNKKLLMIGNVFFHQREQDVQLNRSKTLSHPATLDNQTCSYAVLIANAPCRLQHWLSV